MEEAGPFRICERKRHSVFGETACHGVFGCSVGTVMLWAVVSYCSGSEEARSLVYETVRKLEHDGTKQAGLIKSDEIKLGRVCYNSETRLSCS